MNPHTMDNQKDLEERANTLAEEARHFSAEFLVDPHHDPVIAKTPLDLVEIFGRKKKHMVDYYVGKVSEISYLLAMESSFDGKPVDLRSMESQDQVNYRYALDYWKKYLVRFGLEDIPDLFEKAIARHNEENGPESYAACLNLVCDYCNLDDEMAKTLIPA